MKQKIIRILLPILFLMGNCLAAQFNTLTPIISQKIEVLIPVQKMAETKDRKDKKTLEGRIQLYFKIGLKDRAGFTEIVDEAV